MPANVVGYARPAGPDFVVIGAPKSGTTSLHEWLRSCPGVFLPDKGRSHYFALDYPERRDISSLDEYTRVYAAAGPNELRGEVSELYLSSDIAIKALLDHRPDVKVIAIARHPIEIFISWHNQCFKTLQEDQPDPECAWRLQGKRASGHCIPRYCRVRGYLRYRKICSVGAQFERLFRLFPQEQRMVLTFNQLKTPPAIKRIAAFLGVDDATPPLPVRNGFSLPRFKAFPLMTYATETIPLLRQARRYIKPLLNHHGLYPLYWLVESNLKHVPKPELSPSFQAELEDVFRPDVEYLERMLGEPLAQKPTRVQALAS